MEQCYVVQYEAVDGYSNSIVSFSAVSCSVVLPGVPTNPPQAPAPAAIRRRLKGGGGGEEREGGGEGLPGEGDGLSVWRHGLFGHLQRDE